MKNVKVDSQVYQNIVNDQYLVIIDNTLGKPAINAIKNKKKNVLF